MSNVPPASRRAGIIRHTRSIFRSMHPTRRDAGGTLAEQSSRFGFCGRFA